MELDCDALPSCPTIQQLTDDASKDHADDATWILTSAFIILTMQTGFGLVEMGSSQAGFEVNILMKNAVDVYMGALGYWLLGYGISFGEPSIPFMGLGAFAPTAGYVPIRSGLKFSQYIFQFSFAATATTIVSGCTAMRLRFFVYVAYSFFAVVFYAFVAHWMWAEDGWLRTMGAYDFAGGGPVHLFGGMNGLVAIVMLGPRTGLFDGERPKGIFYPQSPSSQLLGLFMLWWGWIGFNCGSSFGITGEKWVVATRAAISTINASAAGGFVSMMYSYFVTGRKLVKVEHVVWGILGSLVSTSPTCSVINTHEALFVGAVGALLPNLVRSLMKRLKLDDPVNAVGAHVGSGAWGLLAVGLFADGDLPGVEVNDGLFHSGGFKEMGIQTVAILSIIAWSLVTAVPFFYICGVVISRDWCNPRKGLRMTVEEENEGADEFQHGIVNHSVHVEHVVEEEIEEEGSKDSNMERAPTDNNNKNSDGDSIEDVMKDNDIAVRRSTIRKTHRPRHVSLMLLPRQRPQSIRKLRKSRSSFM